MPTNISVKGDDVTLDLLLWRRFGRAGQSMTEEALGLNPGLAALGAVIPLGTVVVLPDAPLAAAVATVQPVSLFE
jgi:phage tail protein X